jgi:hypothetical protein
MAIRLRRYLRRAARGQHATTRSISSHLRYFSLVVVFQKATHVSCRSLLVYAYTSVLSK